MLQLLHGHQGKLYFELELKSSLAFYVWQSFRDQADADALALFHLWLPLVQTFDRAFTDGLQLTDADESIQVHWSDTALFSEIAALPLSALARVHGQTCNHAESLGFKHSLPQDQSTLLLLMHVLIKAQLTAQDVTDKGCQAKPSSCFSATKSMRESSVHRQGLHKQEQTSIEQPVTEQLSDKPQPQELQQPTSVHTLNMSELSAAEAKSASSLSLLRSAVLVLKLAELAESIGSGSDSLYAATSALWNIVHALTNQLHAIRTHSQSNDEEAGAQLHNSDADQEQLLSVLVTHLLVSAMRFHRQFEVAALCCELLTTIMFGATPCLQQAVAAEVVQAGQHRLCSTYVPS